MLNSVNPFKPEWAYKTLQKELEDSELWQFRENDAEYINGREFDES